MPYSFSTFRASKRGQPLYKGQTAEFILSQTCPLLIFEVPLYTQRVQNVLNKL